MSISRCFTSSKLKFLPVSSSTTRLTVTRCASKEVVAETRDRNAPIKFSTSPAGWNFKNFKYIEETPLYKEVILWGTLFSFLTYLMFFREGNETDDELDMPLGQRYLQVQELHLLDEKTKLLDHGHDASSVDEELKKIYDLRKKYNYDS